MNKLLTLSSAFIMIILVNFDMTIINIALVNMAQFFHSNIEDMKIIIGIYLFAASSSFIIFGKLADNWSRKRIFLMGVVLFVTSSLFAGVTSNLQVFIFCRFVQGLGFSATLGQGVVFILRTFPANRQGFASGLAVLVTGVAQAIGPTIGGVILQYWHWHGIFILNVPLGIIAFLCGLYVEDNETLLKKNQMRITNIIWFLITVSSLLLLLNNINNVSALIFFFCFNAFFMVFIYDCNSNCNGLIPITICKNYKYLMILWLTPIFN